MDNLDITDGGFMPRSESRTKTSIWSDSDFIKLTAEAQRLYWLMYSQPNIALTGVLPLTMHRWSRLSSNTPEELIRKTLWELAHAGFIKIDYDTEEVWIRSFIKHDGVLNSPKVRGAAIGQISLIASENIKNLVKIELDVDDALNNAKTLENTLSDTVSDTISDSVCDRVPDTLRSLESGGRSKVNIKSEFENEFLELWPIMAKNPTSGKKLAMTAYCARRKEGVEFNTLKRAVENYKIYVEQNKTEPRYIMQAQTFFGPNERFMEFADMIFSKPKVIDQTQGFTVIKNFDTSSL